MSTKAAYKERIGAKLDQVHAKFAEFKAGASKLSAEDRTKHAKHVEEVERNIAATKAKLEKLHTADGGVWEELVDEMESTWKDLQDSLEKAIANFKD